MKPCRQSLLQIFDAGTEKTLLIKILVSEEDAARNSKIIRNLRTATEGIE